MADVKKFTGYMAPDGTPHDTLKKATDYTRDLKIKEALKGFADVTQATNAGVTEDDAGNTAIYPENLPDFLFAHRGAIMNAFLQDVSLRAPRKSKAKGKLPLTPAQNAAMAADAAPLQ